MKAHVRVTYERTKATERVGRMKRRKTNLLIIINCSLACVLLLISGSLAAYTSLSNAKRTISTVGSNQLFSSNILLAYEKEEDIQGKAMSFSADGDSTFKVTVCNYAQENTGKYAAEDITYTITVSLMDQSGKNVTDQAVLSKYKWNDQTFLQSEKKTDTLPKNKKSEDVYSITVPTDYMKNYKIKITAESNMTGYRKLGRMIYFSEDIASSEWKIDYLNDEQEQKAYDLGCIHTRLTGSEYAELTLTWNTEHVQIDPWFREDIKKDNSVSVTDGSLTFIAGGDTGSNQYNITFYRTSPVHEDDSQVESWENIKSYIQLSSKKLTKSKTKTTK